MPHKQSKKSRKGKNRGNHNVVAQSDSVIKKISDEKSWSQFSRRQMTYRLSADTPNLDLMLVMCINPNYYGFRVYEKDIVGGLWTPSNFLINEGFYAWGSETQQFNAWSFLYELYAIDNISVDFCPSSFAGFGS
jgi:hypothetical protein